MALYLVFAADVGMNGHCFSAGIFDIFYDLPGVFFIRHIIDHNAGPGRSQLFCDRLADTAVGTGHQGALSG